MRATSVWSKACAGSSVGRSNKARQELRAQQASTRSHKSQQVRRRYSFQQAFLLPQLSRRIKCREKNVYPGYSIDTKHGDITGKPNLYTPTKCRPNQGDEALASLTSAPTTAPFGATFFVWSLVSGLPHRAMDDGPCRGVGGWGCLACGLFACE